MKTCTTCKQLKPKTEFYRRARSEIETRKTWGLQSTCKDCMKESKKRMRSNPVKRKHELEVQRLSKARFARLNPELNKAINKKNSLRRFGISTEDYERLFREQNGRCSVCGQPETAKLYGKVKLLSVDHCHDNGAISITPDISPLVTISLVVAISPRPEASYSSSSLKPSI